MAEDNKDVEQNEKPQDEATERKASHATDLHKQHHTDAVPDTKLSELEAEPQAPVVTSTPGKKGFKAWLKTKQAKVILSVAGVAVVVALLFVFPTTRYLIAGNFIRKDLSVTVIDSKTSKPVTDAEVSVPGTTAHTDSNGKAVLAKLPVGQYTVSVQKKYYVDANSSVTVPILSNADAGQVKLQATGRQVPVTVTNKISGKPIEKVAITAAEATAITDDKGEATIVVPADVATQKATLKLGGYNDADIEITVVEQPDAKNAFALTPSGKVYFLSKRTGKINVMKSDLDGANAQVVLAGTGKEEEGETVLLATRDWKYLALLSRRDSDLAKLYLINTSNDQLSVIDEGTASFKLAGWMGHTFVYNVNRHTSAQQKYPTIGVTLKSFDAEGNKLTKLDSVDAVSQDLANIYLMDDKNTVIYTKEFDGPDYVYTIEPNGNNKKTVKTFEGNSYIYHVILYALDEVYFRVSQDNKDHFYEYENGAVTENNSINANTFSQFYPTQLLSPSGQKTFWYEPRDGKNTLLLGDKEGKNGKEVAALSDYSPYGWFTDEYLLVSKGGSELYILAANDTDVTKALKVTDYHKPNIIYYGYGGGYGGGF